jgi:mannose-6-phosphate isomerase-like protein (cupin superfamily)
MVSENKKPNFPMPEKIGERIWGSEELLMLVSKKFTMKKIFIKSGFKGGLQYHRRKEECGVVIEGELIIRYDDGAGQLIEKICRKGDVFHFPAGVVHQEEAITDVTIIEASTPHFNDRVRVEKEYGIDEGLGLKTTSLNEIEER